MRPLCVDMSIVDALEMYRQPGLLSCSHANERLDKLCEVLKYALRSSAEAWIRERAEEPIFIFYSSDSTPLTTK